MCAKVFRHHQQRRVGTVYTKREIHSNVKWTGHAVQKKLHRSQVRSSQIIWQSCVYYCVYMDVLVITHYRMMNWTQDRVACERPWIPFPLEGPGLFLIIHTTHRLNQTSFTPWFGPWNTLVCKSRCLATRDYRLLSMAEELFVVNVNENKWNDLLKTSFYYALVYKSSNPLEVVSPRYERFTPLPVSPNNAWTRDKLPVTHPPENQCFNKQSFPSWSESETVEWEEYSRCPVQKGVGYSLNIQPPAPQVSRNVLFPSSASRHHLCSLRKPRNTLL